eukprot:1687915-Pyramimonas_sp.AAC.1
MGAAVANLLDLGWEAPDPWLWIDPSDQEAFDLLEGDADRLLELALVCAVEAQRWQMASTHYHGGGAELGGDLTVALK